MQRVDPSCDPPSAWKAIDEIRRTSRVRCRPRWWTSRRGELPGTRYLYSAQHAGVCLVVRDGCVTTVMSRRSCQQWRRQEVASRG
jgi:hypothetical protein